MIKIKRLEIAGLIGATKALRLPYSKDARSEGNFEYESAKLSEGTDVHTETTMYVADDDVNLMRTLKKRGDVHAKVLRGIMVWVEIIAPRYFWQEFDVYRIGVEKLSSESTMHTIGNGNITIDNFSVDETTREALTPHVRELSANVLKFGNPTVLESRVLNKFGRDYEIWNDGRIYALAFTTEDKIPDGSIRNRYHEKKLLEVGKKATPMGYFQVRIGGRKGKSYMVHRLMAEAFIPNPDNLPYINHKDGDKGNCSVSNLEWCTGSENCKHAYDTGLHKVGIRQKYLSFKNSLKFTESDILDWKEMIASGMSLDEVSELTGAGKGTIRRYTNGDRNAYMSDCRDVFDRAYIYDMTIDTINELAAQYAETKDFDYVRKIKTILPESFMQKRVVMMSYQALRRIVEQRHDHRLYEWREFCGWVATLPFAEELITGDLCRKDK